GRAIGVLLNLINVPERGVRRPVIGEQQITMADNRGQNIVEVVCHAARELTDRLHLVRLSKIGLESLLSSGVYHQTTRTISGLPACRDKKQSHRPFPSTCKSGIHRRDAG